MEAADWHDVETGVEVGLDWMWAGAETETRDEIGIKLKGLELLQMSIHVIKP